jgi:type IV pilus assembly protein PilA
MRSRMAANETSAVASVRSINTSEVVYQSTYGGNNATLLTDLSDGGVSANCAPVVLPTSTSSCLIDPALASGVKNGYNFTYAPVSSGGAVSAYVVNADPVTTGGSGQRHFYSDQTLVIRVNNSWVASSADSPM